MITLAMALAIGATSPAIAQSPADRAMPAILPLERRAETEDRWLKQRLDTLLPTLLGLFFVPLFYVAIKRVFPDKPKGEAAAPSTQEGS